MRSRTRRRLLIGFGFGVLFGRSPQLFGHNRFRHDPFGWLFLGGSFLRNQLGLARLLFESSRRSGFTALLLLERLEMPSYGELNFFHHFFANARNGGQFLRSHIGKLFYGGDAVRFDFFDGLGSDALQLGKRGSRSRDRRYLRLDFLALLFLTLDIDVPADQFAGA